MANRVVEHADGAGEWVSVDTHMRLVEQCDQLYADAAGLAVERDHLLAALELAAGERVARWKGEADLRSRVAELEDQYQSALHGWRAVSSSESAIAMAVGVVEVDPEAGPIGPGDPSDVLAEVRRLVESEKGNRARVRKLTEERDNAWLRVAELEAPPVVPEGWRVALGSHWTLWLVHEDGSSPDEECARISVGDKWLVTLDGARAVAPWEALAALEYAHRTGQRPPHAGDE